ncbi:hypothetical protein [Microbacterium gilvum]|uniref:hypothetical protein n=1 Tax=Microbacterium gilvum TaxID=1336204 RepID=UPI0031EDB671
MTEPQVWTLIGVLAAALVGVITIVMSSFSRQMAVSFGALEKQIESVRSELKSEIGAVRSELKSEISAVRSELKSDIAHLERDVNFLHRREIDDPPA